METLGEYPEETTDLPQSYAFFMLVTQDSLHGETNIMWRAQNGYDGEARILVIIKFSAILPELSVKISAYFSANGRFCRSQILAISFTMTSNDISQVHLPQKYL